MIRATLEWRWTPSQVGALTLREMCMYVDALADLADARKKQQSQPRGRRRG
jgi:hypothetical protein